MAEQPKPSDFIEEQLHTAKKVKITDTPGDAVLATLLRPRKPSNRSIDSFTNHLSSSPTNELRESNLDDGLISASLEKSPTKSCESLRLVQVTARKRTDSDQLLEINVYLHLQQLFIKQCLIEALSKCVEELRNVKAIQLCYNGKIINKLDLYVMLAQYVNKAKSKEVAVIAVKTFAKNVSVTAEVVFSAIKGNVNGTVLNKVFSIMSDITSLNTSKVSGVNKHLTDFYMKYHGRNIHSLKYFT